MRARLLVLFLIWILFPLMLQASGKLSLQGFYFPSAPPEPVEQIESRLQAEYDKSLKLFGTSANSVIGRFNPFVQLTTTPNAWSEDVFFDPKEVNLTWKRRTIFLRGGYFTLAWEGTDGLNPMDIATMKNYSDPLNPLTKSSLGIQTGFSKENFDFEAAWIPLQTKSDLPGETSAWWPRRLNLPLRTDEIEARLPDRVEYLFLNREKYKNALTNNYAARIKIHGDLGDAAFAYFEGASETPMMQPTLDVVPIQVSPKRIFLLQSPVKITPIDYRRRTGAALLSTTVADFVLRAATRYDQPIDGEANQLVLTASTLPSWSQQSIVGVERSFDIGQNLVTGILQFAWVHRPKSVSLVSVQDLFDEAVLAGLRYPFGESWTLILSGMRSGRDKSYFGQAQLSYRISDSVSTEAGYFVMGGEDESLLGVYDENDRASLKLNYAF